MKAKDLRGKNIEDIEEVNKAEKPEEEDAVAAAYENISKRLESLRGGQDEEESRVKSPESSEKEDEVEVELTEWKGPRKPTKEDLAETEEESDTDALRKVKLKNLENVKEEEDEIDPLDDDEEEEGTRIKGQESRDEEDKSESRVASLGSSEDFDEDSEGKPRKAKDWEPEENDPLDEEDEGESRIKNQESRDGDNREELRVESRESSEDFPEEDDSEEESRKSEVFSDNLESVHKDETAASDESEMPEDLDRAEVEMPAKREFTRDNSEEEPPVRQEPDSLEDLTEEKPRTISQMATDDDYFIPNLKGSRQREVDMSYNAHPQTGGVGDSYAPRQNNMEGNDPNSFFSQHQPQPPKRANKFHLLVLVIIGIAVIGFTVYILKGGFGDINLGSVPSPSPSMVAEATPTPTPTPTPAPEIDRGEFTIRVLNGTTTSGLARTVSDSLEELGYETSNPGNASANDVEQTEIRVKEGSESAALFEALKADLASDYEAIQGDDLSKSASYDAEVIIGAK